MEFDGDVKREALEILEKIGSIPALNPHLRSGMVDMPSSMLIEAWNFYIANVPVEARPPWARNIGRL